MKTIRLKDTPDKFYQGHAKYVVSYDHAAGRDDRYFVWLLNADDPVTIGRELDLSCVRGLIAEYESWFETHIYWGDRKSAMAALRAVSASRLSRSSLRKGPRKKSITLKGLRARAKLVKQIVRLEKWNRSR